MSLCLISNNNTVLAQLFPIQIINKCETVVNVTLIAWSACPGATPSGTSTVIIPAFFILPGTSIFVSPPYPTSSNGFWASATASTTINGVAAWNVSTTPNPYCPNLPPWNWGNGSNGLLTSLWVYPPFPYVPQIVFDD